MDLLRVDLTVSYGNCFVCIGEHSESQALQMLEYRDIDVMCEQLNLHVLREKSMYIMFNFICTWRDRREEGSEGGTKKCVGSRQIAWKYCNTVLFYRFESF